MNNTLWYKININARFKKNKIKIIKKKKKIYATTKIRTKKKIQHLINKWVLVYELK